MEAPYQQTEIAQPHHDNSHLLNNKQGSDVSFIVDSQKFYAHKAILCGSSKYFRNLLNSPFQPNGAQEMELEVEMRDISPVIFYKVLQFIYSGHMPDKLEQLDDNTLLGLLGAAVFYQLPVLQAGIEQFMADHRVTVANVTPLWRLALETGATILAAKCAEMFRECSDKIAQLPDLQEQMWEPLELASFLEDPLPVSPIKGSDEILIQSFLDSETNPNPSSIPQRNQIAMPEMPQDPNQVPNFPPNYVPFMPPSHGNMIPPYPFYPPNFQQISQAPSQAPSQGSQKKSKSNTGNPVSQQQQSQNNWINIYPQNIGNEGKNIPKNSGSKAPPPSYKTLASKQKRLPMLQGPIWEKALEKMGTVIDLLREVTQADFATLFLHDPITNELISHVTHPEIVDIALPADLGIAGSCFQNREIINSPAAYTDARFYSGIDRRTGTPTLAILAVPIFDSELQKTLGVIELLNKKRTTSFSADNEGEVQMVSRMISKIVDKASQDVRSDVDRKGIKRIHLYNNDEGGIRRPGRRNAPVLHFKQMKEPNNQ